MTIFVAGGSESGVLANVWASTDDGYTISSPNPYDDVPTWHEIPDDEAYWKLRNIGDANTHRAEIGLKNNNRIRCDASGIYGWHETSGIWISLYGGGSADNLGNHTATQDLDMSNNNIDDIASIDGGGNAIDVNDDLDMNDNTILNNASYIHLRDQKSSYTDGGTFNSGGWRKRDLNTKVTDEPSACSLSSSQFTLDAGTYIIFAIAPAYRVLNHQIRLRNTSDSSTELLGSQGYGESSGRTNNYSIIMGSFTIGASKTFEIQHRCEASKANNGFGVGGNVTWGNTIFTQVSLWKVG